MSGRQNSVHLVITKDVPVGNQAKWLELATELTLHTRLEDGCIVYTFLKDSSSTSRFFIVEEWESQSHLDAHGVSEHFQRLVPIMDSLGNHLDMAICTPALDETKLNTQQVESPTTHAKILVLYDSSSKCTEKMAALVAEGASLVPDTEVRIRCVPGESTCWESNLTEREHHYPFATFDDVYWADGFACGTPTHLGSVSWRMKKFWDDFSNPAPGNPGWGTIDGKIGCAFTSSGGHAGGGELVNQAMNTILMNFGITVFGVTDYVSHLHTMHYGAVCAKEPREEVDKMACRRQGTRLAELAALYLHNRRDLHPLTTSKARDVAAWGDQGVPPKKASMEKLLELNMNPHPQKSGF